MRLAIILALASMAAIVAGALHIRATQSRDRRESDADQKTSSLDDEGQATRKPGPLEQPAGYEPRENTIPSGSSYEPSTPRCGSLSAETSTPHSGEFQIKDVPPQEENPPELPKSKDSSIGFSQTPNTSADAHEHPKTGVGEEFGNNVDQLSNQPSPVSPDKRGGRPHGPVQSGNPREELGAARRIGKLEVVCWQRERQWILAVELPGEFQPDQRVSLVQGDENLLPDESETGCWRLATIQDEIIVRTEAPGSVREMKSVCGNGNHLLFKLSGGDLNRGRCVKKTSSGSYLVIVPENWERSVAHAGPPPVTPEPVCLESYRAHFFDLADDSASSIVFLDSTRCLIKIGSSGPRFELKGEKVHDAGEQFGPLFCGRTPSIEMTDGSWADIGSIVVGQEGILGRNLLLKVVQQQSAHAPAGSSLHDLAIGLRDVFRDRSVFPPATSNLQLRREAWLALYGEFLTDEPRISLEGVGLARWSLEWPDWFRVPELLKTSPWLLSESESRNLALVLLDSMRTDRAVELHGDESVVLNWNDLNLQATQQRLRIGAPGGQHGVASWDGDRAKRVRFLAKLLIRITAGVAERNAVESAAEAVRAVWDTLRQCDEHAPTSKDRLLVPVGDARRLNPDWWRFRAVGVGDSMFRCDTCGRIQAVSVRGVCPRHRCPGSLKEIRRRELDLNHYRLLYEATLPGSLRVEEHTAQLDKEKAREFQREFREGKINVLSCSTTFELGVDLGDLDTIFLRNVPPEAFNYAQRVGRCGRRSGFPGFAVTYCRRGPHDLYHFSEPQRMLAGKVQPPVLALRNERILTRHMAAVALSFFFRASRERFSTVEGLFGDLTSPCGIADFKSFLFSDRSKIEATLRNVVPEEIATQLGLSDGSWAESITAENSRFALAETEVSSDYRTVVRLEESARNARDYRTAEWAQGRANAIAREEVLSFLSRKAVIPKYGFPVDVVELDTQRTQQNQEAFEVLLQRDLAIAISEFAPTSRLVANKREWTSYGLKKVAEKEWEKTLYARCATHNVFIQWKQGDPTPTLPCGDRLQPRTYVIPQFGFVTNRDKSKEPKARPARVFSTRPYFAGSLGHEPGLIPMPAASPRVTVGKASPGLMVVLCEGRRGEGFYLCGRCGAGFRTRQRNHRTPQGQDCRGTLERVSLGHKFVTDVLQLRFHHALQDGMDMVSFAFSLAYAVVEGAAEVLEVPSIDLSTTVAHGDRHVLPPIVLYDNVPGGAGLVARLEKDEVLKRCLQTAMKRVEGACGCATNTSCYGCLRSYRNQFAHETLQRGPVQQYLTSLLSTWG